jgi:pyruvate dehydrogenase E2 component (dihydrolipoamide acetyltransferase)
MTEGNLVKWLKQVGDCVARGDVLAEVETDKATMEVEAVDEGVLVEILVAAGTSNVGVNEPIATLEAAGEKAIALTARSSIGSRPHGKEPPPVKQAEVVRLPQSPGHKPNIAAVRPSSAGNRIFISPLARRTAGQSNVGIDLLRGSGPRGRIVVADVIAEISNRPAGMERDVIAAGERFSVVRPTSMRQAIASRVSEAKRSIPHFYLTIDCNVDTLLELRRKLNDHPDNRRKVSITDFIIRASALALKNVPEANACWSDGEIHRWNTVDIAVAVALEDGLITPIVSGAENRSVDQIAAEMMRLTSAAKLGQLRSEEFKGGSFSISNLGMYGIRHFEAIVNPPHAAILAVGACERRPVVIDDQISIATIMSCTLSADHRIIDGAGGAILLGEFKKLIENPLALIR